MAKIEYSIRSKDETGPGVKSAEKNLKSLEGGVKSVSNTLKLLMGAGAIAGITMALRKIAQAAGEAEKAFAAMHPETQKSAGSLADWNRTMNEMKVSGGGVVAAVLTPIRQALLDIIDPAHQAKLAISQIGEGMEGWASKYTTSATKLADSIADAQKKLQEAISAKPQISADIGEYQRMLQNLQRQGRPDFAQRTFYYQGKGYDASAAQAQAQKDIDDWDRQVKFLTGSIATLQTKFEDAARAVVEIPKWIEEQLKKGAPATGGTKPAVLDTSALLKFEEDISTALREATGNTASGTAGVKVWSQDQENRDEELIENAVQRALKGGAEHRSGDISVPSGWEKFMGFMDSLATKFASLAMILDPINTIMNAFWQALQPVVDALLGPLVGALVIIGQTMAAVLAPALRILSPVIEFIGKAFVWLYNNAIQPIANGFIYMLTVLGALGKLIYYIVTFQWGKIGSISWKPDEGTLLDKISYDTLGSAGAEAINEGGTTSTYSTGRDITVNVVINSEVITGEGGFRELALMLNREIQNAMALGVA